MSTVITTINSSDLITNSRTDINNNFASLNTNKIETSVIDTDTAMAANSDAKIPSQKAVKAYIDTQGGANASETVRGIVQEATDAQVTSGTATGSTGAKLFVSAAKLATRMTALLASYQTTVVYRNGTASKTLSDASTTQTIAHGLGKTPTRIRFSAMILGQNTGNSGVMNGSYDANSQNYVSIIIQEGGSSATVDETYSGSGAALFLSNGVNTGAQNQTGVVSVDATNITITWTKNSTPVGGSAVFLWEAQA